MKQKFIMRRLFCLIVLMAMTTAVSYASETLFDSSQFVGNGNEIPWAEVGNAFTIGDTAREVTMFGFIDVCLGLLTLTTLMTVQ